jgi:hypothetical protein
MGGRYEGRCQEAGGEKLEKRCEEQEQLAEAPKEGLVSKWAVLPMTMRINAQVICLGNGLQPMQRRLLETNVPQTSDWRNHQKKYQNF